MLSHTVTRCESQLCHLKYLRSVCGLPFHGGLMSVLTVFGLSWPVRVTAVMVTNRNTGTDCDRVSPRVYIVGYVKKVQKETL